METAWVLLVSLYLYIPAWYMTLILFSAPFGIGAALILSYAAIILLLLYIGVYNISNAVRIYKSGSGIELKQGMKITKLRSAPYLITIGSYVVWMAINSDAGIQVLLIAIPAYITSLLSSIYSIAYIKLLKKEQKIGSKKASLYYAMHFIPFADMVSTIVILITNRKRKSDTLPRLQEE